MRKSKRYHAKPFTYGIVGRLAGDTYCSHMVPITREAFATMLKRYSTGPRDEQRFTTRGAREWTTNLSTSQHLHAGYDYREVYLYAVRG